MAQGMVPMSNDKEAKAQRLAALCRELADCKMEVRRHGLIQESLRRSEARFRAIVSTAAEGIVTVNERGIIQLFNPAAERIFGYATSEVIGTPIAVLMPYLPTPLRPGDVGPSPLIGENKTVSGLREVVGKRKDGSLFPLEFTVSEFRDDHERFFAAILRDISERKEAEDALRESEERFRNLIEGSIQGILVHRDWKPLFANHAFATLLGYDSPEEILALESLSAHIAPHERARVDAHAEACQNGTKISVQWEYLAIRKDGVPVTLEKVVRLVNWQGAPATQCTVIDVTERKRAEERARMHQAELMHMARLSTMGELATTLAHELNQPLTAIVTYTEGVARRLRAGEAIGAGFREVLERTAVMAKRAAQILRGIRDFVRKQEIARQPVDLNAAIAAAIDLTGSEARHKGIAVVVDLAKGLPQVKGSFIQLEQVVLNLIRNAFEAMESTLAGEHVLRVSTARNVSEEIHLTVQDTGPGLPPELGLRVMEPFVTTKKNGLGMGLAISRTIVEAHGGRLWVSSPLGGGTMVHVALPSPPEAPAPDSRVRQARPPARSSTTISERPA